MSASRNVTENQNRSPVIEVVALALRNTEDAKYLLARRSPGGSGAGFWEFPGGKIEPNETQEQALRREIFEELSFDLSLHKLRYLGENLHCYDNRRIKIYLWRAEVNFRPELRLIDHDCADWFSKNEIKELKLSAGDKYFISLI